jgi:hypothetical protein
MARSEHNRDAYRQLFGIVGAALQAFALFMIVASLLVAPWWVVVVLGVSGLVASVWSWRKFAGNFMMPTIVGIVLSVVWMVVIGVGFGFLGWSP